MNPFPRVPDLALSYFSSRYWAARENLAPRYARLRYSQYSSVGERQHLVDTHSSHSLLPSGRMSNRIGREYTLSMVSLKTLSTAARHPGLTRRGR